MFCTKCGKELVQPDNFCVACGAPEHAAGFTGNYAEHRFVRRRLHMDNRRRFL